MASRTGKVISVPEPTTALIVPDAKPATTTAMISKADRPTILPDR